MADLVSRSHKLTGYLEFLIDTTLGCTKPVQIITPRNANHRGAQLSLLFAEGVMPKVAAYLSGKGIVFDERKPDVIRVAPAPLYNTFTDVWYFVHHLHNALSQ